MTDPDHRDVSTTDAIRAALAAATPGRWEYDAQLGEIAAPRVEMPVLIADLHIRSDRDKAAADAHLIAKAPQWLTALLDVADVVESVLADWPAGGDFGGLERRLRDALEAL